MAKNPTRTPQEPPENKQEGAQKGTKNSLGGLQEVNSAPQEVAKSPVRTPQEPPREVITTPPKVSKRKPCPHCGERYDVQFLSHLKVKHPEVLQATMAHANEARLLKKAQGNGNGNHAPAPAAEALEGIPDGDPALFEEKPKGKPAAKNPTVIPTATIAPGAMVQHFV